MHGGDTRNSTQKGFEPQRAHSVTGVLTTKPPCSLPEGLRCGAAVDRVTPFLVDPSDLKKVNR